MTSTLCYVALYCSTIWHNCTVTAMTFVTPAIKKRYNGTGVTFYCNLNNLCTAYFGLNLFITMGNTVLDSTRPGPTL